jgi:peptidyl-tRNA hydrolase, PTH1 family
VTQTAPWLVLGLGNPGARYQGTRHNVGQLVVEYLASGAQERLKPSRKARCDVAETRSAGTRLVLAVPHSFMNESGGPASALMSYYSGDPEQLIVVQDEIDLPFGALRIKYGGGDNGHNGLRSIRTALGTGDWYRVRVGVGRGRGDAAGHVLGGFSSAERKALPELVERAAASVPRLIDDGLAAAQNEFNT